MTKTSNAHTANSIKEQSKFKILHANFNHKIITPQFSSMTTTNNPLSDHIDPYSTSRKPIGIEDQLPKDKLPKEAAKQATYSPSGSEKALKPLSNFTERKCHIKTSNVRWGFQECGICQTFPHTQ